MINSDNFQLQVTNSFFVFCTLPTELVFNILDTAKVACSMAGTCKKMSAFVNQNSVWELFLQRDFPLECYCFEPSKVYKEKNALEKYSTNSKYKISLKGRSEVKFTVVINADSYVLDLKKYIVKRDKKEEKVNITLTDPYMEDKCEELKIFQSGQFVCYDDQLLTKRSKDCYYYHYRSLNNDSDSEDDIAKVVFTNLPFRK